jgi:hypothetical protein
VVALKGDAESAALMEAGAQAAEDARREFFARVRNELADVIPEKAGIRGLAKLDA